jgi:hypothetical protein
VFYVGIHVAINDPFIDKASAPVVTKAAKAAGIETAAFPNIYSIHRHSALGGLAALEPGHPELRFIPSRLAALDSY